MPAAPARLALQTGRLDDRRPYLEPHHELWDRAYRRLIDRDEGGSADRELLELSDHWPSAGAAPGHDEALAVTLALASPFAAPDRILEALGAYGAPAPGAHPDRPQVPVLVSPWDAARPTFPYIYDPDREQRAPIIAVLDGPRDAVVGAMLETIKSRDATLADAIVLGAELETLELLDTMSLDADRTARRGLSEQVEHDRARWSGRAEQARARQRLEASRYGWHSDNFPPGCIEAARVANRHDVEMLLERSPDRPA